MGRAANLRHYFSPGSLRALRPGILSKDRSLRLLSFRGTQISPTLRGTLRSVHKTETSFHRRILSSFIHKSCHIFILKSLSYYT